jgi:DNA-binding NarL/FixJ family response regulator
MDEKRVGIRVLVCHQNQLFAECLATALSNEEDFEALSMDWRTADFGAAFASVQPTILLVDADLPNNLAVDMVHELQRQLEHGKAVMVVSTGNEHTYIDCLRAGAAGYVQDSESLADLKRSLEIPCLPRSVNWRSKIAGFSIFEQQA